jgi:hypothetical protein
MGQLLIIIHTTTHGYRQEVLKALFKQIPNLIKGSLFQVPREVERHFWSLDLPQTLDRKPEPQYLGHLRTEPPIYHRLLKILGDILSWCPT